MFQIKRHTQIREILENIVLIGVEEEDLIDAGKVEEYREESLGLLQEKVTEDDYFTLYTAIENLLSWIDDWVDTWGYGKLIGLLEQSAEI